MFGRFLTDSGIATLPVTDYESIKCDLDQEWSVMSEKALRRYYRILDGSEDAKYLHAKRKLVVVDLNGDDEALWIAHRAALTSNAGQLTDGVSLLDLKSVIAQRMLTSCSLCERRCGANRTSGERGHCGVLESRVCCDFLHLGEEPDLVPSYTIFFAGCTFNCVYCQNWDISTQPDTGVHVMPATLARKIELKHSKTSKGFSSNNARNVNWVGGDPTSNLSYILDVLRLCDANIPQVWNSNMYLTEEAMKLLENVVDVYLTDYKYGNDACAIRLSNAKDYTRIVQRNHLIGRNHAEMIVRHLVLPGHIECCTRPALTWIAENLGNVKVNVMGQYKPEHRAREFREISGPLSMAEYREALSIAEKLGLDMCD